MMSGNDDATDAQKRLGLHAQVDADHAGGTDADRDGDYHSRASAGGFTDEDETAAPIGARESSASATGEIEPGAAAENEDG